VLLDGAVAEPGAAAPAGAGAACEAGAPPAAAAEPAEEIGPLMVCEDAGGPSGCETAAAAPELAAAGAPELAAAEAAEPVAAEAAEAVSADWAAFTPEVVCRELCMARTWAGGKGGQCHRRPRGASLFCPGHLAVRSHGQVDGPVPAAKLGQFVRAAAGRAAGARLAAAGARAEGLSSGRRGAPR
ncbi:unnamed protein product, partial [Prorocentrum cordatum]